MSGASVETQQLAAWLDDAYAMENGLVSILQSHALHFDGTLPAVAARLRAHIDETRKHADRLEHCLRLLGTSPSRAKSAISSLIGTVEGSSTMIFRDTRVKDALADYAAEQLEVACYTALVAAARALGRPDVADLCQQNLDEDLAMASWLKDQLPTLAVADAMNRPRR